MALSLGTSEVFKRKNPEALGSGTPARLLSFCAAIQVGAVVIYALSGSLWLSFSMLWARSIANSVSQPVESAWLNRNLDAPTRATVISMTGQANSIGQAAGGPALGWVANVFSIPAALLCSTVILSPTVFLYRRLIVRDRGAIEPVPTPAD
jgi:DHA3 family tetracycline resistance protein-like MFS transporter